MNKSKLHFLFLLALFSFTSSFASVESSPLVVTIPKSGSHLVGKAISLIPRVSFSGFEHTIIMTETEMSPSPEQLIIFLVRDLRDVFVSYVYHLDNIFFNHEVADSIKLLSKTEKSQDVLTNIIHTWAELNFSQKLTAILEHNDLSPVDFKNYIEPCIDIAQSHNTIIIRFENLVGPKGKGNKLSQINEVTKIVNAYGKDLSRAQIIRICDRLFGIDDLVSKWNNTFRSGQIGSWETHFEENHKETFKTRYNDFLFYFGYVDTPDW